MCGIFGIVRTQGTSQKSGEDTPLARDLLIGIQRLEYRGYDSAGMALSSEGHASILQEKALGKVYELEAKVSKNAPIQEIIYGSGIAHTRWATHGGVSSENCHPHFSQNKRFSLVHNGIIENHSALRDELIKKGTVFDGQTDSEVVAKLLDENAPSAAVAWKSIAHRLHGAYAFLIIDAKYPGHLFAVRNGSPLIFGKSRTNNNLYLTSDQNALAGYAEEIIFLEDGESLMIEGEGYSFFSPTDGERRGFQELQTTLDQVSKGDFEHFMLKEIYDQSEVVTQSLLGRINPENLSIDSQSLREIENFGKIAKVIFIACGTSYHASLCGATLIRELTSLDTQVCYGHEAISELGEVRSDILYVFLSQSGETADTLDPLKYLKHRGAKTFSIVNVPGSSIARLSDAGLYCRAGVEIGVASTKAFTGQYIALVLLATKMAALQGKRQQEADLVQALGSLSMKIEEALESIHKQAKDVSKQLSQGSIVFFLGREHMLPIAHEGALKLREISYQPTISLPSGELKHGSLALIDEHTISIVIMGEGNAKEKNRSSLHEISARKGYTIAISTTDIVEADISIIIPDIHHLLSPLMSNIALQLLSYETAYNLNREIDKPRNLAKSVTVR